MTGLRLIRAAAALAATCVLTCGCPEPSADDDAGVPDFSTLRLGFARETCQANDEACEIRSSDAYVYLTLTNTGSEAVQLISISTSEDTSGLTLYLADGVRRNLPPSEDMRIEAEFVAERLGIIEVLVRQGGDEYLARFWVRFEA